MKKSKQMEQIIRNRIVRLEVVAQEQQRNYNLCDFRETTLKIVELQKLLSLFESEGLL